jgi:hypothetical protein
MIGMNCSVTHEPRRSVDGATWSRRPRNPESWMSIRPLPAFWINDRFLDHFEYAIDGTACQSVIETKSRAHFPERLLDFFPNDADGAAVGAVSYMGTRLLDTDGILLGTWPCWTIVRCQPSRSFTSYLIFSPRGAVAELRRLRAEAATREREAHQRPVSFLASPKRNFRVR